MKLAMYLVGSLATAYFARELDPAAFGGFYLRLSVVQFANRIPHGFGGACQKRLAEADPSGEELLGLTLGLSLGGGCVAAALAFLGRDRLAASRASRTRQPRGPAVRRRLAVPPPAVPARRDGAVRRHQLDRPRARGDKDRRAVALGAALYALPGATGYRLVAAGLLGCGVYTVALLLLHDAARGAVGSLGDPLRHALARAVAKLSRDSGQVSVAVGSQSA